MKRLSQSLLSVMFLPVCIFFSWSFAFAQTNVKGTVTNEANDPIAGVTVAVKGATNATTTDEKGNFSVASTGNATRLIIAPLLTCKCKHNSIV